MDGVGIFRVKSVLLMDGVGIFRVKSVLLQDENLPDVLSLVDIDTGTECSVYTVIYSDEVKQYADWLAKGTECRLVLQPAD